MCTFINDVKLQVVQCDVTQIHSSKANASMFINTVNVYTLNDVENLIN